MPTFIKSEPDLEDDGLWRFVAGLGRVRSGPRGRRFRARQERESVSDQTFHPTKVKLEPDDDGNGVKHALKDLNWPDQDFKDRTRHLYQSIADFQRNRSLENAEGRQVSQHGAHTRDDYIKPESVLKHEDTNPQSTPTDPIFFSETTAAPISALSNLNVNAFEPSTVVSNNSETTEPPGQFPGPSPPSARPCSCPISFDCGAKQDHLIDCRTLVLERDWAKWQKLQREIFPELPPLDIGAADEKFVDLPQLGKILNYIGDVEVSAPKTTAIRRVFGNMRRWIRDMERFSLMQDTLHSFGGLQRLEQFVSEDNRPLRDQKQVPIDIVEDLTFLSRKWRSGDLSVLPLRGLCRQRPGGPLYPDPDWPWKMAADYFGDGHLINGQKWLRRAEMSRDGAHGPLIAGISGNKELGARSIVMGYHDEVRKQYYADVDQGKKIWYIGTALKHREGLGPTNVKDTEQNIFNAPWDLKPTSATQALMTSIKTQNPVRVFRSFGLSKIVPGRPKKGYRYDGLYRVVKSECLKVERQIYRFKMVRLREGQGPLRGDYTTLLPEENNTKKRKRRDSEQQDQNKRIEKSADTDPD